MRSLLIDSGMRIRTKAEIDDLLIFGLHVSSIDFSNMGDIHVPFSLILGGLYSEGSDINKSTLSLSKTDIIKALLDKEPISTHQKIHAALYLEYSYSLEEYFAKKAMNNAKSLDKSYLPLIRTRKHEEDFLVKNIKNIYHTYNMFNVSIYNPMYTSIKAIETILYQDDIYTAIEQYKNYDEKIALKLDELHKQGGKVKDLQELVSLCNSME